LHLSRTHASRFHALLKGAPIQPARESCPTSRPAVPSSKLTFTTPPIGACVLATSQVDCYQVRTVTDIIAKRKSRSVAGHLD